MKKKWLTVAIIAGLFGAIFAAISLQNYLRIYGAGMLAESSFCSISEYINCDLVEISRWSDIGGIPISGLGLIYYILILAFALYSRFSRGFKKPTVAFAWWSTCLAVLYSMFLAFVSIFILKTFCLSCIGMYIANLALFISLYMAMNIPLNDSCNFLWGYWATLFLRKKKGIDFMPKFFPHFLISMIFFIVGFVFVASAANNIDRLNDNEVNDYLNSFYEQTKYNIAIDRENTHMWGTKGAPVTVIEFSDYRCPFCKIAAFTVKPFLAEYKEDMEYYFVNYPLDSECNPYMHHQMHPGACLAAKAGFCADKFGKYWKYHDEMFKSEEAINHNMLSSLAAKLDIDVEEFNKCLKSVETDRRLAKDVDVARQIYITGTPSIFINGRHLKFWRSPQILKAVVKREIKNR